MYTLRKIVKENVELNIEIGNAYTLCEKERSPEEFKRTAKIAFINCEPGNEVYGFIVTEGGGEIIPLSSNHKNYIMSERGNTFANVSKK